jgi:hypothetical protein
MVEMVSSWQWDTDVENDGLNVIALPRSQSRNSRVCQSFCPARFLAERLQCKRGRGYKSLNFVIRAKDVGGGAVTQPKIEHSTVTYCRLGLPTTIFRPVGLV